MSSPLVSRYCAPSATLRNRLRLQVGRHQSLKHSHRVFGTTSHLSRYEHQTYFQQGQGSLQQSNGQFHGYGGSRESTVPLWLKNVGIFFVGVGSVILIGSPFTSPLAKQVRQGIALGDDGQNEYAPVHFDGRPGTNPAARLSDTTWFLTLGEDTDSAPIELSRLVTRLDTALLSQQLAKLTETTAKDDELRETQETVDTLNKSQLKFHKVLLNTITSSNSENVILDEAALTSRPIVLSDQSRLPPSKACLVRILNKQGKNAVFMLGVDLDYHEMFRQASYRWPTDCSNLHEYLQELVDEFAELDRNAEEGVAVYLYTNRAIVDMSHESARASMTRYERSDFPPGFPLRQMRQIRRIQASGESVDNRVADRMAKTTEVNPQKETP